MFNRFNKKLSALGRLKVGERNKTEALYEAHLKLRLIANEILWYKFEGIKLRLADNTFYSPDFVLMNANSEIEFHEVKGAAAIFQDDAKVKIKVASDLYPFKFFVVYPRKKRDGGGFDIQEI